MLRAAVPEAPVNVNHEPWTSKHDVRFRPYVVFRSHSQPVPRSGFVQQTSDENLGRGVTSLLGS